MVGDEMKTRLLIIIPITITIIFGLLLVANFTVYKTWDNYERNYLSEEKVRMVCDVNWLQKPINCKPIFPDGFDFNSGSITVESNWP